MGVNLKTGVTFFFPWHILIFIIKFLFYKVKNEFLNYRKNENQRLYFKFNKKALQRNNFGLLLSNLVKFKNENLEVKNK